MICANILAIMIKSLSLQCELKFTTFTPQLIAYNINTRSTTLKITYETTNG